MELQDTKKTRKLQNLKGEMGKCELIIMGLSEVGGHIRRHSLCKLHNV